MEQRREIEMEVELGGGSFCLRLNGLAINVRVKRPEGVLEAVNAEPALPFEGGWSAERSAAAVGGEEGESEAARLSAELAYYRQASQDIYEGLGKLAKEINVSIQDLSLAEIMQTGMSSPGERLDQMRNQVTDVLQMTEKATLNILDLVEQIREDCESVQGQLLHLSQETAVMDLDLAAETAGSGREEIKGLWEAVLSRGEVLETHLKSLVPASPAEGAPSVQGPHFPLAEVIQIVLEFCGNETVKQHLRAVQAQQETAFNAGAVEQAISALALTLTMEDGFYQFPVEQVLTILRDHCQDERVKGLLSKMLASAGKLFPMPELPLEGQAVEEEIAVGASEGGGSQAEVLSLWEEFFGGVQRLAEMSKAAPAVEGGGGDGAASAVAQEALGKVERITSALSRITEALAFQDLSGQRLLKVLHILRQLQVQVLTLLVAAGQKLKMRIEGQDFSQEQQDALVQEELDRMLHGLTHVASEDGQATAISDDQPLDQDAVNDLLSGLGF